LLRLTHYGGGANSWKYGGSYVTSMVAMLLGSYFCMRRRYALYILTVMFLAGANLHYGYRSQIAVDFVVLVFTLPFFSNLGGGRSKKTNTARTIVLLVCSLAALWFSQKIVTQAAKSGYFGEDDQEKFQQQSSGKLGVLVGARPEIPVSLTAIADRPILGHGSYAIDPKYILLLHEYQYKYGYSESDVGADPEYYGIPTHSHIFTIWVEAGLLGSLFWFYTLWLIIRAVIKLSNERPPLAPLYVFFFVTFFWDILFSPYGSVRRIYESFFLVLLINVTASPKVRRSIRRKFLRPKRVFRGAPGRLAYPRLPRPDTAR
jgi:hypothetical protein